MKIGFFCPHSDPLADLGEPDAGGQCLYEANIARALAAAGHTVTSFTRRFGNKAAFESICDSAPLHRIPMGNNAFMHKEDMGPHLPEFVHNLLGSHSQQLNEADLFHGHYWDGGYAALSASMSTGKPLLFTSHSLGILKRDSVNEATLNYQIRIPAEYKIMSAADRIIALSTVEKDALINRYGISGEKISIVPGGVDVDTFAPRDSKQQLKKELGLHTDFAVLAVGRLDSRKGFVPFIDGIPNIVNSLAQINKTVTFLLPCGGGELNAEEQALREDMVNTTNRLGITQHVHFFSRPDDATLRDMYGAADAFVCPSLYEPFGLVLVEAMAAGTAVVSTNRGGPNDIVDDGVDGFLANPENTKEFSNAVSKLLLLDDSARETMHAAAKAKARARYGWDAVANQIATVYEEVLSDQRASHRL